MPAAGKDHKLCAERASASCVWATAHKGLACLHKEEAEEIKKGGQAAVSAVGWSAGGLVGSPLCISGPTS